MGWGRRPGSPVVKRARLPEGSRSCKPRQLSQLLTGRWSGRLPECPGGPGECGSSVLTSVSTTTGTRLPRKPGGARRTSVENRTARRRIRRRTSLEGPKPRCEPPAAPGQQFGDWGGQGPVCAPAPKPFPFSGSSCHLHSTPSVPSLPCQPQLHLPLSVVLPDSRGA